MTRDTYNHTALLHVSYFSLPYLFFLHALAVIVGSASLFRPWFLPEIEELKNIRDAQARARDGVEYDDISTLGEVILDNVLRIRRLRIYLGMSLGFWMVAFACGAFAILGSEKRNLYMAIATIVGGGGLVLAIEIGMTLVGPTRPPKWLHKLCLVERSRLDKAQTTVRVWNVTKKKENWWPGSALDC